MDGLKTLAVTVDARGIATVALQRGDVLNKLLRNYGLGLLTFSRGC